MQHRFIYLVLAAVISLSFASDKHWLIGTQAVPWTVADWINTEEGPTLESLKGQVVLVRWFMGPQCPYCSASASALQAWHEAYADDGLVVLGFYHHKGRQPLSVERVKGYVAHYGYTFPVAIDYNWTTLKRWWLERDSNAQFTSVSFLLDHESTIRDIHFGGQYVKGDGAYEALEANIETLLQEAAAAEAE